MPFDSRSAVRIEGLRELRSDLRVFDRKLPVFASQAHRAIATKVAERARAEAVSQGSTAAKAAPSIRAYGSMNRATVNLGGARHPFALGAEFGAVRFPQFRPWRGAGAGAGYFLWPTVREMHDEIEATYLDTLEEALGRQGTWDPI